MERLNQQLASYHVISLVYIFCLPPHQRCSPSVNTDWLLCCQ